MDLGHLKHSRATVPGSSSGPVARSMVQRSQQQVFDKQNHLGSLEGRDLWGKEQWDWALGTTQGDLIFFHSLPIIVPDYIFCSWPSHILELIHPIWGNFIILCLLISYWEKHGSRFPLFIDGSEASWTGMTQKFFAFAVCLLWSSISFEIQTQQKYRLAAASIDKATEESGQRKQCWERRGTR